VKKGDIFSAEFCISEEIYTGFIQLFKDKNPLHTDAPFARSKGFTGTVMHGNILGGFLSYLIGERLPLKNVIIHSQEIKYMLPVYKDQELDLTAEVVGVYSSVNAVEFKFYFTEKNTQKQVAKGKIQIGII
jgi:3-hydroxybutyryl-CoA dehydratase